MFFINSISLRFFQQNAKPDRKIPKICILEPLDNQSFPFFQFYTSH